MALLSTSTTHYSCTYRGYTHYEQEFCLALHLAARRFMGAALPDELPSALVPESKRSGLQVAANPNPNPNPYPNPHPNPNPSPSGPGCRRRVNTICICIYI